MKKTVLFLAALTLLTACYTTNDMFVPEPEMSYKMSHELVLTTTLPLITIPQNIGFNYRLATPALGGSQFNLNYFLRYERGIRRIQAEFTDIEGNERIKSDNIKSVLMPTFQVSEDFQLGLGFGGNYVFGISDGYVKAPDMFVPVFNFNINLVSDRDEGHLNFWNIGFTYADRMNKKGGVRRDISTYYDSYNSTTTYYYFDHDLGSALICKSLKFTYTSEREMKDNPAIKAILRFDFGFAYVGDEGRYYDNMPAPSESISYTFKNYQGFNIPLGFSVGLKF